MWVNNVVGIGNASGFVEPLEATALATIVTQSTGLAAILKDSFGEPSRSMKALYNRFIGETWDEIRDFLALHYAFNTRRDTPFWQHCRAATPLGSAEEIVEFYRENGPSAVHQTTMLRQMNSFGIEGYLAVLVGQRVPYRRVQEPSADEREIWRRHCAQLAATARNGFTVREALDLVRKSV
jgi:tryptophan halogenase